VPANHISRSYNDTYYVNKETVLRCHTSAHQAQKLREGHTHFLLTGDVYRRDAIDATHYPVFHQVRGAVGVMLWGWYGVSIASSSASAPCCKIRECYSVHFLPGPSSGWFSRRKQASHIQALHECPEVSLFPAFRPLTSENNVEVDRTLCWESFAEI
jgi:hypothetical protein